MDRLSKLPLVQVSPGGVGPEDMKKLSLCMRHTSSDDMPVLELHRRGARRDEGPVPSRLVLPRHVLLV
jgi:hypothetical protein